MELRKEFREYRYVVYGKNTYHVMIYNGETTIYGEGFAGRVRWEDNNLPKDLYNRGSFWGPTIASVKRQINDYIKDIESRESDLYRVGADPSLATCQEEA